MTQSGMATPLDMIEAHITWMRAGTFAENTATNAGKLLLRAHRQLPEGLHAATGDELAEWLASNSSWSEQTVSRYYKDLVRFYRWASGGRDPWISWDPSVDLRRPVAHAGLPRPATEEAARVAIYDMREPWRLAARFAGLAGLRPCEIATVRRDDVTERNITIKGKGGRTRAVPTHPLIWETVASRPGGRLVTDRRGDPYDAEGISKAGAYHLRKHKLAITLYALRHYFGTTIQERYRDLRVTQELMGHASPTTTQVYTLVTSERMREAIDCLPFGTKPAPEPAPERPATRSPRQRVVRRARP